MDIIAHSTPTKSTLLTGVLGQVDKMVNDFWETNPDLWQIVQAKKAIPDLEKLAPKKIKMAPTTPEPILTGIPLLDEPLRG